MKPKRYDRRKLMAVLERLEAGGLYVVTIPEPEVEPGIAEIIQRWLTHVVGQCVIGNAPDVSAFPDLAVTARTPADDPRHTWGRKAAEWSHILAQAGRSDRD